MPDPFGRSALVVAVLSFMAGATVPSYYFIERMQGFGRWVASRIPYRPPPGMDKEEALREAQRAADAGATEADE